MCKRAHALSFSVGVRVWWRPTSNVPEVHPVQQPQLKKSFIKWKMGLGLVQCIVFFFCVKRIKTPNNIFFWKRWPRCHLSHYHHTPNFKDWWKIRSINSRQFTWPAQELQAESPSEHKSRVEYTDNLPAGGRPTHVSQASGATLQF